MKNVIVKRGRNDCNINKCNRLMILIAVLSVEIECKGSDK